MEESPPPVPPKDLPMDSSSRPPTAASGSKRKRDKQDYDFRSGRLDATDLQGQTPKRSRSHVGASDNETSTDDTPLQNRSLRRKKGTRNLSAMNLRHAASAQAMMQRYDSPSRESRFQEGSLTDKPSEEPPSAFTRLPHTNSGQLSYREELMEEYQDGMPTPRDSVEAVLQYERDTRDERVAEITARQRREEGSGIFRFGKSLASSFHPVTLWNRLWNEQKDELTRQNMLEAEQNARRKAEAEVTYAQMKNDGQFGLKPVAFGTPRDSGIAFDSALVDPMHGPQGHLGDPTREEHEVLETSWRQPLLRSVRSRIHMRRPSLQSLRQSVKRVKSHANIGDQQDRESSSSLSPVKVTELSEHSLLRSASKWDIKKQQKLSKRVSDLETKLNKARSDLNEALVMASPAPQLGNKYQRFTPSSTLRKPKFVPGALPTLHSEGVLLPAQPDFKDNEKTITLESRPRYAFDANTAFDIDEDEETIKAPREKPYPAHANQVFKQPDGNHQDLLQIVRSESDSLKLTHSKLAPAQTTIKHAEVDSTNEGLTSDDILNEEQSPEHGDPGAKFEEAASDGKNNKKSKKRPIRPDDRAFKPGADDDDDADDAEWEEATQQNKRKKRKSDGPPISSSPGKAADNKKSKIGKRKPAKHTAVEERAVKNSRIPVKRADSAEKPIISVTEAVGSEDELAKGVSRRTSIASEDITLEPVYEEEEETTTIPLKDAPSKPTAKATPARFVYSGARSRSNSPRKQADPSVGIEEHLVARAGHAARNKRSASPSGHSQANTSTGPNGTVKRVQAQAMKATETYVWPDDIF